ncbi:hypothetical protein [Aliarcobacter butzleri]|uniref:hypothetical protein n=1 Tax=Aliarcobacter butzleri TaxID=28197 RepID=UPI0012FA1107|nr:hypothetical protein [Aliarcobacter butzleri]
MNKIIKLLITSIIFLETLMAIDLAIQYPHIEKQIEVREYNFNNKNRVNIFISMGQSNALGIFTKQIFENKKNIYMPIENIHTFPKKISFTNFNPYNHNKATPYYSFINTATKFADIYNLNKPLIIVNISRGGKGFDTMHSVNNDWNMNENFYNSLFPQSIHYLKVLFNQLQKDGYEPYVIGIDWNQWEAEKSNKSIDDYYIQYSEFFNKISDVIPNKDFNLFMCNPTSNFFEHKEKVSEAFHKILNERKNTYIYYPDKLVDNIFKDEVKVHYNEFVHQKIAEYILNKIK